MGALYIPVMTMEGASESVGFITNDEKARSTSKENDD